MEYPLTEEIQSIVVAVQRYKKFVIADAIVRGVSVEFDWYKKTFEYYCSLILPNELKKNHRCFETVLCYPIEKTLNTECNKLQSRFVFAY